MKILNIILKDENLANDLDVEEIAERTVDFSGSDLHELCRCAAMNSFIEHIKQVNNSDQSNDDPQTQNQSNQSIFIKKLDFEVAFQKMSVKNIASVKANFNRLFEEGRLD